MVVVVVVVDPLVVLVVLVELFVVVLEDKSELPSPSMITRCIGFFLPFDGSVVITQY